MRSATGLMPPTQRDAKNAKGKSRYLQRERIANAHRYCWHSVTRRGPQSTHCFIDWQKKGIFMMSKNTVCLWYERDAEEAARFYAKTFP